MTRVYVLLVALYCVVATHFRYGTMFWKQVPGGDGRRFEFTMYAAWNTEIWQTEAVGDTKLEQNLRSTGTIIDSPGVDMVNLVFIDENERDKWIMSESTFTVDFDSNGLQSVHFEKCCRLRNEFVVSVEAGFKFGSNITVETNKERYSTVVIVPPAVDMYVDTIQGFQLPILLGSSDFSYKVKHTDSFQSTNDRRYTDFLEGTPDPRLTVRAPKLTINENGFILFRPDVEALYALPLYVETFDGSGSLTSTIPVDFVVRARKEKPKFCHASCNLGALTACISDDDCGTCGGLSSRCVGNNNPAFGDSFINGVRTSAFRLLASIEFGQEIEIRLTATDPDADDTVTFSVFNMPASMTLTQNEGNPAEATLRWTPQISDNVRLEELLTVQIADSKGSHLHHMKSIVLSRLPDFISVSGDGASRAIAGDQTSFSITTDVRRSLLAQIMDGSTVVETVTVSEDADSTAAEPKYTARYAVEASGFYTLVVTSMDTDLKPAEVRRSILVVPNVLDISRTVASASSGITDAVVGNNTNYWYEMVPQDVHGNLIEELDEEGNPYSAPLGLGPHTFSVRIKYTPNADNALYSVPPVDDTTVLQFKSNRQKYRTQLRTPDLQVSDSIDVCLLYNGNQVGSCASPFVNVPQFTGTTEDFANFAKAGEAKSFSIRVSDGRDDHQFTFMIGDTPATLISAVAGVYTFRVFVTASGDYPTTISCPAMENTITRTVSIFFGDIDTSKSKIFIDEVQLRDNTIPQFNFGQEYKLEVALFDVFENAVDEDFRSSLTAVSTVEGVEQFDTTFQRMIGLKHPVTVSFTTSGSGNLVVQWRGDNIATSPYSIIVGTTNKKCNADCSNVGAPCGSAENCDCPSSVNEADQCTVNTRPRFSLLTVNGANVLSTLRATIDYNSGASIDVRATEEDTNDAAIITVLSSQNNVAVDSSSSGRLQLTWTPNHVDNNAVSQTICFRATDRLGSNAVEDKCLVVSFNAGSVSAIGDSLSNAYAGETNSFTLVPDAAAVGRTFNVRVLQTNGNAINAGVTVNGNRVTYRLTEARDYDIVVADVTPNAAVIAEGSSFRMTLRAGITNPAVTAPSSVQDSVPKGSTQRVSFFSLDLFGNRVRGSGSDTGVFTPPYGNSDDEYVLEVVYSPNSNNSATMSPSTETVTSVRAGNQFRLDYTAPDTTFADTFTLNLAHRNLSNSAKKDMKSYTVRVEPVSFNIDFPSSFDDLTAGETFQFSVTASDGAEDHFMVVQIGDVEQQVSSGPTGVYSFSIVGLTQAGDFEVSISSPGLPAVDPASLSVVPSVPHAPSTELSGGKLSAPSIVYDFGEEQTITARLFDRFGNAIEDLSPGFVQLQYKSPTKDSISTLLDLNADVYSTTFEILDAGETRLNLSFPSTGELLGDSEYSIQVRGTDDQCKVTCGAFSRQPCSKDSHCDGCGTGSCDSNVMPVLTGLTINGQLFAHESSFDTLYQNPLEIVFTAQDPDAEDTVSFVTTIPTGATSSTAPSGSSFVFTIDWTPTPADNTEKSNEICVRVQDNAGNANPVPYCVTVTLDAASLSLNGLDSNYIVAGSSNVFTFESEPSRTHRSRLLSTTLGDQDIDIEETSPGVYRGEFRVTRIARLELEVKDITSGISIRPDGVFRSLIVIPDVTSADHVTISAASIGLDTIASQGIGSINVTSRDQFGNVVGDTALDGSPLSAPYGSGEDIYSARVTFTPSLNNAASGLEATLTQALSTSFGSGMFGVNYKAPRVFEAQAFTLEILLGTSLVERFTVLATANPIRLEFFNFDANAEAGQDFAFTVLTASRYNQHVMSATVGGEVASFDSVEGGAYTFTYAGLASAGLFADYVQVTGVGLLPISASITVAPGDIDLSKSLINDDDFEHATVGDTVSITFQLRDTFLNPIPAGPFQGRAFIQLDDKAPEPFFVEDGLFQFSFRVTSVGEVTVGILFRLDDVDDSDNDNDGNAPLGFRMLDTSLTDGLTHAGESPFSMVVSPGSFSESASVKSALEKTFIAGETSTFRVTARDAQANPREPESDRFTLSFTHNKDQKHNTTASFVAQPSSPEYIFGFRSTKAGPHSIQIKHLATQSIIQGVSQVTVVPASTNVNASLVSGLGFNTSVPGKATSVRVQARDEFENIQLGAGQDRFFLIVGNASDALTVDATYKTADILEDTFWEMSYEFPSVPFESVVLIELYYFNNVIPRDDAVLVQSEAVVSTFQSPSSDGGLSRGLITGVTFGSMIFLAFSSYVLWRLHRYRKKYKSERANAETMLEDLKDVQDEINNGAKPWEAVGEADVMNINPLHAIHR